MCSLAIQFMDDVRAGKPLDLLPHNSAIWAIRYLRHYNLGWVHNELLNMHWSQDPSHLFPCLQEIYYLLNEYILFLSNFLRHLIPASAKTTIPAFNGYSISHWTGKFKKKKITTILAYTQSLEPRYASGWSAVQKKLWSWNLFWIWFYNLYWEGQSPSINGIEPLCLQLLQEALKLYHTAAVEARLNDKIQMDTTSSTKLLTEVEKNLPGWG
ncbi:hypothetical protein DFH08DRAFT_816126 [Mycena albidolilacea]|uniref:Uncharacterized protein n=1 Tax=Mycena albidolilacea TaxID=1033008 RepID=A0AAD6ZLL7_9AGAR|nr:hypothetical protein DFH08DRAFT_816126 [Mycena albidolilacea]